MEDTYEFEVPEQWIIDWNEANDYQHDSDTDADYSDYYDYEIEDS